MRSMWHIWPSGISKEACEEILSLPRESLMDGRIGINTERSGLETDIRKSKMSMFPYHSDQAKAINDLISPFVIMANRESFGFSLNGFREFQYSEYRDEGFYGWHQDVQWLQDRESQRKISVTVQLSDDDYAGGDFEFHKDIPQPTGIRGIGTVIVFPSMFYHQVTPVTMGIRKSLVGWYEGACFT